MHSLLIKIKINFICHVTFKNFDLTPGPQNFWHLTFPKMGNKHRHGDYHDNLWFVGVIHLVFWHIFYVCDSVPPPDSRHPNTLSSIPWHLVHNPVSVLWNNQTFKYRAKIWPLCFYIFFTTNKVIRWLSEHTPFPWVSIPKVSYRYSDGGGRGIQHL